ncbi:alpha/beta hydrolase family protein [Fontivita pretiosa]|uniref:alpha/beta hydrolase family protein n=1 Tax=Fontivita pretiosa TaxID=2989684 RepID=UPI003D16B119
MNFKAGHTVMILATCVAVLLLGGALLAAAAPDGSIDSRFVQVHNKDHPHEFKADVSDLPAWQRRAQFLQTQARVALGLWPPPPKTPLNPVIHGRIERDGYTIEKVYFSSMPGHYVTGNLYRPSGRSGRLPAVLAPYGHWPNGRFIWRDDNGVNKDLASGAEVDPLAARTPLQANCAMLARMGCIVFHYDMVGYCDSTAIEHKAGFVDVQAVLRLQSFMGLQTWNSIRSLDFVLSLPDVDPDRIAVSGSSSGGTQTIALCAVDPRPHVAFPIVMISMNMQGGCICENAPLYRVGTNNVELACLFAPKPLGAAAANDWTADFETRGLPEMKRIWRLFGAEDRIFGRHINYPHNHNLHSRELQYNFLNRHLKLGLAEPVKELPFKPLEPRQLSVFDDQHPMPPDAADAATLRKTMTRLSDEQLAAMDPQTYRTTVRAALEAMVVDQMPAAAEVEHWQQWLGRRGSGQRVPFKMLEPRQWTGQVVVWAHPQGVASLTESDPAVRRLLDAGRAILAIDPFMSGSFVPPAGVVPTSKPRRPDPPYAGYTLGYERSVIANRVHDLLTAIAFARGIKDCKSVQLIGIGRAGAAALLARALAGQAIDLAAIDLDNFDFDQITDENDPMLLPGGLKYGGILGFVPLCTSGQTLLVNPPAPDRLDPARKPPGVHLGQDSRQLIDWLLSAG